MKKQTFLLLMIFASNIMLGGDLTREELEKKSLPELEILLEARCAISGTLYEKLSQHEDDLSDLHDKYIELIERCMPPRFVSNSFLELHRCHNQNREEVVKLESQMLIQQQKCDDARREYEENEAHANKQLILEAMREKRAVIEVVR